LYVADGHSTRLHDRPTLLAQRADSAGIDVGGDHAPRAALQQLAQERAAYAAGGAGDHDDLALEVHAGHITAADANVARRAPALRNAKLMPGRREVHVVLG